MSHIVAEMYEIQQQIGAGGGGVVYLGRHIRLDKTIVLKADKRRLSTDTESLRREVNILKNLSHTYIPQVYDFVQEDGMVYTVMDYIDGESLDKLLARGEKPSQPELIKWACELLEALAYLHNSPPHGILHGDIKPANIMRRPNGDVCLIDYNIALALGEDGAVKVGFSRGYASPEHYGADYVKSNREAAGVGTATATRTSDETGNVSSRKKDGAGEEKTEVGEEKTEVDEEKTEIDAERTEIDTEKTLIEDATEAETASGDRGSNKPVAVVGAEIKSEVNSKSTTTGRKGVLLDVRSDLYSLGATLYHLISGKKPAQNARDVIPLTSEVCSQALADIIKKAMEPLPDDRYQTAEEMLEAFFQLPYLDKRTVRHRRRIKISAAVAGILFLIGGAMAFVGLKQMEQYQNALALAEYSANALAEGQVSKAITFAMDAMPRKNSILDAPVTAQAQKALTDALGVYELADSFQALDSLELPSTPFDIVFSPEGSRFAAVYAYDVAIYDTESQSKLAVLPTQMSAFSDIVFADENIIIYAGKEGVTAYDLNSEQNLWFGEEATILSVSVDGSTVAAVNRDAGKAIIYSVDDGGKKQEVLFNGLHLAVPANDIFADSDDYIFSLNRDGSLLAVSFQNGALKIFDLNNEENSIILYDESSYMHFEGGFSGINFAFAATGAEGTLLGIVDCEKAVYKGGYESADPVHIEVDEDGIYVADGNLLVGLDKTELKEQELAYTDQNRIRAFSVSDNYILVATDDQNFAFYDRGANCSTVETSKTGIDFVRISNGYAIVANRDEPALRLLKLENHEETELLTYDARYKHDEARISQDGQSAMLFDINSFRIYQVDGKLQQQMELPDSKHIYDQQFRRTQAGAYLEVIWYDGMVRRYNAKNGELIFEEKGEPPEKDLNEEFQTERYRIQSSLHEAPEVFDQQTGKHLATLEEDAYLTYVTQVDDYLITEYVGASGNRFGILLNDKLEKLAVLPDLCDVWGDMLVFDYESGNLRQSRLYSLSELLALGEAYK